MTEGARLRTPLEKGVDSYGNLLTLEIPPGKAIVYRFPLTSRNMERNPHKMEFEIVAPCVVDTSRNPRKSGTIESKLTVPFSVGEFHT